jgi:hypothetical protein
LSDLDSELFSIAKTAIGAEHEGLRRRWRHEQLAAVAGELADHERLTVGGHAG